MFRRKLFGFLVSVPLISTLPALAASDKVTQFGMKFTKTDVSNISNILSDVALFEYNDKKTRDNVLKEVNKYITKFRGHNLVMAYCDETNNPPEVISENQLKLRINFYHKNENIEKISEYNFTLSKDGVEMRKWFDKDV